MIEIRNPSVTGGATSGPWDAHPEIILFLPPSKDRIDQAYEQDDRYNIIRRWAQFCGPCDHLYHPLEAKVMAVPLHAEELMNLSMGTHTGLEERVLATIRQRTQERDALQAGHVEDHETIAKLRSRVAALETAYANALVEIELMGTRMHPGPPYLDVVFDGPPGPIAGRFVEVEDARGYSVNAGEWIERAVGLWVLRIPWPDVTRITALEALREAAAAWRDYSTTYAGNDLLLALDAVEEAS